MLHTNFSLLISCSCACFGELPRVVLSDVSWNRSANLTVPYPRHQRFFSLQPASNASELEIEHTHSA